MSQEHGSIFSISGPLVVGEHIPGARLYDVVYVGKDRLIGEIIEIRNEKAWIQVYEETSGLTIGEDVVTSGSPLSVELGPGLLQSIFDGIQRPLSKLADRSGIFISRGISVPSLDREKKWEFKAVATKGASVSAGDVLGEVQETSIITQKIMVPPGISGTVQSISSGTFTVEESIATIKTEDGTVHEVPMMHKYPIRRRRPVRAKVLPTETLITGQRVFDTFFPLAKGGIAAIPGPFGSGKSVSQQQIAKWCNAQIIVYIGCGERGNEMTDVLKEFPELTDPQTGKPLMDRTVLIANTSNMPIAAREASIYTGITIAEYYRDMGYDVALMADSTSRWAEALREMSGRLEEMPGEEGYPAYLTSRIAEFYERAGLVECLQSDEKKKRMGSISVIGAVSPPGGDLSEPVSQATLSVVKVFWALDASLAYARHYPSVNWLQSYSLYEQTANRFYAKLVDSEFPAMRAKAMEILQKEADLLEIIRIVGMDSLSNADKVLLDTAKSLREDYLQQVAFDPVDTYSSIHKQRGMLGVILTFHEEAMHVAGHIPEDADISKMFQVPVKKRIAMMKNVKEDAPEVFADMCASIKKELTDFKGSELELEHHEDMHKTINFLPEDSDVE